MVAVSAKAGRGCVRRPFDGQRLQRSSGSAFVELAMVVMFLYLLLLGTVELTFLLLDSNRWYKAMRNAVSAFGSEALNASGTPLPSTSPSVACQGETLEALVTALVHCGRCPCPPTAGAAPEVSLHYCIDHDRMIYVTVRARYSRPYSAVMRPVFGPGTTLTADALLRIPAFGVANAVIPRCAYHAP